MRLQNRWKDRRTVVAMASLCLAVGLLLPEFLRPADAYGRSAVHFVGGFLIGISLVFNLAWLWKFSRQRRLGE